MASRGGMVVGADHSHGGVKFPVTVMVEEEDGEVNIPRELLADPTVYTFRGTNKKLLDRILRMAGLSVSDEVADVRYGDIVICKRSVEDKAPRIVTGTIEQMLDQINQSNGCKPIGHSATLRARKGGRIPMHQKLKDWQIENPNSPRWQKKKERIQQLSSTISGLRGQLSRDIASDDEKTALTALVIAVMDKTAERVGNDDSADNGHFGVTGFRKNHISVVGNTVHLDYTGKSGTKHEKSFTDERIAKALKRAIKNSPSKFIFETSDGFRIKSDKVNRYLDEFGITAKDIRGYMANRWMVEKLKKQNSKVNTEDPEKAKKDRKKIFNQVLKETAGEVGHGRGTLKKHYMIPELPVEFIEHGRIIDMKNLGYYREGGKINTSTTMTSKERKIRQEAWDLVDNLTKQHLKSENVIGDVMVELLLLKENNPDNPVILKAIEQYEREVKDYGKYKMNDGGKVCGCFHSYMNQNHTELCERLIQEDVNEIPKLREQVDEAYEKYQSIKPT